MGMAILKCWATMVWGSSTSMGDQTGQWSTEMGLQKERASRRQSKKAHPKIALIQVQTSSLRKAERGLGWKNPMVVISLERVGGSRSTLLNATFIIDPCTHNWMSTLLRVY